MVVQSDGSCCCSTEQKESKGSRSDLTPAFMQSPATATLALPDSSFDLPDLLFWLSWSKSLDTSRTGLLRTNTFHRRL